MIRYYDGMTKTVNNDWLRPWDPTVVYKQVKKEKSQKEKSQFSPSTTDTAKSRK